MTGIRQMPPLESFLSALILTRSTGGVRQRMREQGVLSGGGAEKKPPPEIPADVPRALHRFYRKGAQ